MRGGVFVCHASQDAAMAQRVVAALEDGGIPCWIAPRDILPGENYTQAIIDGLSAAPAVVLVFSAATNASPHVHRELEATVGRGTPIIPVRLEDVEPSAALRYFIGTSQWLDVVGVAPRTWQPLLVEAARRARSLPTSSTAADHAPPVRSEPATESERSTQRSRWLGPVVVAAAVLTVAAVAVTAVVLSTRGDDSDDGRTPQPDAVSSLSDPAGTGSDSGSADGSPSALRSASPPPISEMRRVVDEKFDDQDTTFGLGEYTSNTGTMTATIRDGVMEIRVQDTGSRWKSWTNAVFRPVGHDFWVQASDVARPANRACGLMIGDGRSVVTVVLDRSNGEGEVNKYRNATELLAERFDTSPGATGVLALHGVGDAMGVWVGDQQVASVPIGDLRAVIRAGLVAMGSTATCEFDDFLVAGPN